MWGIQAYPDLDSDEPFILTTDWSSLNIAGVLSQKQDGVEQFLGCWGRKYNSYNLKSEETIFQDLYVELSQFEFIVIHKKGSEKINADILSRAKHLDEPTEEENDEYQASNEVGEMKITFASGNPVVIG